MARGVRRYMSIMNKEVALLNQLTKGAEKPVNVSSGPAHDILVATSFALNGQDDYNSMGLEGINIALDVAKKAVTEAMLGILPSPALKSAVPSKKKKKDEDKDEEQAS